MSIYSHLYLRDEEASLKLTFRNFGNTSRSPDIPKERIETVLKPMLSLLKPERNTLFLETTPLNQPLEHPDLWGNNLVDIVVVPNIGIQNASTLRTRSQ